VSAGAIVLGQWWADWPAEEAHDVDLVQHTSLVRCTGVVPGHVFDTHNEEDDWDELRVVAELLRRRGLPSRLLGIPTRGALVFSAGGPMEVVGEEPFVLE
jgi:hypothetical protein